MTPTEFNDEFDILYNNLASNSAPPINEYEKSVFLTKAQEEIVWGYIRPQSNKLLIGIDADVLRRYELEFLVTREDLDVVSCDNDSVFGLGTYKIEYTLSDSIMAILSETLVLAHEKGTKKTKAVIPLSAHELTRVASKNYTRPPKHQAWKIAEYGAFSEIESTYGNVTKTRTQKCTFITDLPSGYSVDKVIAVYIRSPKPIIIGNSECPNNIRGISAKEDSYCELPEFMHTIILQRAVELAKQAYVGVQNLNNNNQ